MGKTFVEECGSLNMIVHRDPLLWFSRKRLIRFILSDKNGSELSNEEQIITKQNWTNHSEDDSFKRLFFNCYFKSFAKSIFEERGIKLGLLNTWYQVYDGHKTYHCFHHHDSVPRRDLLVRHSSVLYLELPDKNLTTQFFDEVNGQIVRPKVKQGDTITFDIGSPHRSPPNETNKRKIIISFNSVEQQV